MKEVHTYQEETIESTRFFDPIQAKKMKEMARTQPERISHPNPSEKETSS